MMELEHHQLELRYESIRLSRPEAEKRLLASLAESDQLMPVVVVAGTEPDRYVLVDGYKRVRLLRRLGRDTVRATLWDLPESDALLMDRFMRTRHSETALEQGWLLREMATRFRLSQEELARRFGRSLSWVNRRLALVQQLPEEVQERVRRGEIVAHAAMRYLVPLARANLTQCRKLIDGIAGKGLTSRQIGALYVAWRGSSVEARERIAESPLLFLRAHGPCSETMRDGVLRSLLRDFDILSMVARRAVGRLEEEGLPLLPPDRDELRHTFSRTLADIGRLSRRVEKETGHVGARAPTNDPAVA